jgi:hypothetical protein
MPNTISGLQARLDVTKLYNGYLLTKLHEQDLSTRTVEQLAASEGLLRAISTYREQLERQIDGFPATGYDFATTLQALSAIDKNQNIANTIPEFFEWPHPELPLSPLEVLQHAHEELKKLKAEMFSQLVRKPS